MTRNYDKAKPTPKSVFIVWQATKMSIGYIKTLLRPVILKADELEVINYNHIWNADSIEYINSSVCSAVFHHLKL